MTASITSLTPMKKGWTARNRAVIVAVEQAVDTTTGGMTSMFTSPTMTTECAKRISGDLAWLGSNEHAYQPTFVRVIR